MFLQFRGEMGFHGDVYLNWLDFMVMYLRMLVYNFILNFDDNNY